MATASWVACPMARKLPMTPASAIKKIQRAKPSVPMLQLRRGLRGDQERGAICRLRDDAFPKNAGSQRLGMGFVRGGITDSVPLRLIKLTVAVVVRPLE